MSIFANGEYIRPRFLKGQIPQKNVLFYT